MIIINYIIVSDTIKTPYVVMATMRARGKHSSEVIKCFR